MKKWTRKKTLSKIRLKNYKVFKSLNQSPYVKKEIVHQNYAAVVIQQWLQKRSRRTKFKDFIINPEDPISMEPPQIGKLFYLIEGENKIFQFEPQGLYSWYQSQTRCLNPFNNRELNLLEVKRLCRQYKDNENTFQNLMQKQQENKRKREIRPTIDFLMNEYERVLTDPVFLSEITNEERFNVTQMLTTQMMMLDPVYASELITSFLNNFLESVDLQ